MAGFCCYGRISERILVIRMWQKQGGHVFRVEICEMRHLRESRAWLPDSPRLPVGASPWSFSSFWSDEEYRIFWVVVFCKGEGEARRVRWFLARIVWPGWSHGTDCILLQSFGPKHPLNVYRAKSDKNFLLPVYNMTPGSHTFGDSRELSFPLLLFHFGNAGWKRLFFCCSSDATWHH